ncbi:MAG TPA: GMC family oxidoreductase [Solirubrobacteraceae bacterium]|nr:GMC family oxidoreductase [Solirubrobacteraceae bacterium]
MPTASPSTDVVIVGMGAAGGIAADVLTDAGLSVVGLEAGERVAADMMSLDEIRNDIRGWLVGPKARGERPTWRERASDEAGPPPWPILMVNAVGGSTVHYDGVSFRLLPWHFEARSRTIERYGADAIPRGSTVADWPISYEELEPYYDLVEHAVGVSGTAGNVAGVPSTAGNPFEGPRSREYPMPPLRSTGWLDLLSGAASSLGWHPYPAPAAINSVPYDGRAACTYCGYCKNNGCYVGAKGSPEVNVIRRAESTGRLRVETGARAVSIEVDGEGLATGVRYVKDGQERFQPAAVVLVGGYVFENVRLLLLSVSRVYPNGLANNHGQVGRHFTAHVMPCAFGLFEGTSLNRLNGSSGGQGLCVDDWNGDAFDHAGLGFIGGALLMALQQIKPIETATEHVPPEMRRWGSEWKRWMRTQAGSVGSMYAQIDALTYEDQLIDLDPAVTDPLGLPVARVTHAVRANEANAARFMAGKMEAWLQAAGATRTWLRRLAAVDGRHAFGGTRMGDDPDASVVDRHGLSHEAPNLGILGASVFPTAGGYNPTLTVQATAWRTAEHLVHNWSTVARS